MRLGLLLASGLGVGYIPVASGTFGALWGVLAYGPLVRLGGWPAVVGAIAAVSVLGVICGNLAERELGEKDPGQVVLDEVAGQLVTFLGCPTGWRWLAAGFFAFRVFDVIKPFPARRLEALPGGSGIMADDLAAGVYANLSLQALRLLAPGWLGT
ncbi:MAG TPA: phosphatidylglycerophosphatase A [Candidatus Polarisedimenticolaceae bacterium]|nr:phosphatidylglycerophosphatase A [Candidatus Polarisedimenticolaceae bacterium]